MKRPFFLLLALVLAASAAWFFTAREQRLAEEAQDARTEARKAAQSAPEAERRAAAAPDREAAPGVPAEATRRDEPAAGAGGGAIRAWLAVLVEHGPPVDPEFTAMVRAQPLLPPGLEAEMGVEEVATDKGAALLPVQAGIPLRVTARAQDGLYRTATAELEPVAAGEQRTVRLRLPANLFWGKLVREPDDRPLYGAEISLHTEYGATRKNIATSDRSGLFQLLYADESSSYLEIRLRGFGQVFVPVTPNHETPAEAVLIRMRGGAYMQGRVLEQGGSPVADAEVVIRTRPFRLVQPAGAFISMQDPKWSAVTDASGGYSIENIPSESPLDVSVITVIGSERKTMQVADNIVLQQGEWRTADWVLGAQGRIRGRVVDAAGQGLAEVAVGAFAPVEYELNQALGASFLISRWNREPVAAARSDAAGNFELTGVPPGTWLVGTAGQQMGSGRLPAPHAEFSPCGVLAEIAAAGAEAEVTLTLHAGLTIGGRVLGPEGRPVDTAFVSVYGQQGQGMIHVQTGDDGSFEAGPLVPGDYLVWSSVVTDGGTDLGPTNRVTAAAGSDNVELRATPAGGIRGRVIDGVTGEPRPANIMAYDSELRFGLGKQTEPDGSFDLDGLQAGRYTVVADGEDGWVGFAPAVVVGEGVSGAALTIRMEPGSPLEVRVQGPRGNYFFRVEMAGEQLQWSGVEGGLATEVLVPAGSLRVLLTRSGEVVATRDIVTVAGEKATVVFELEDDAGG